MGDVSPDTNVAIQMGWQGYACSGIGLAPCKRHSVLHQRLRQFVLPALRDSLYGNFALQRDRDILTCSGVRFINVPVFRAHWVEATQPFRLARDQALFHFAVRVDTQSALDFHVDSLDAVAAYTCGYLRAFMQGAFADTRADILTLRIDHITPDFAPVRAIVHA